MAFQPIDLQVNIQNIASVADQRASETRESEQAKRNQFRDRIQERRLKENTTDETGEEPGNRAVGEEQQSSRSRLESRSSVEGDSPKEGRTHPSEPQKGNHFDIIT